MATDDYWQRQRALLFEGPIASLNRLPMCAAARRANGPTFANLDALQALVLDRADAAGRLLEYVPDLFADLAETTWANTLPEYERTERLGHLPEDLVVGTWLRTGAVDPALAANAMESLEALHARWGGRVTQAGLLHLILLACESQQVARAVSLYEQLENRPIEIPPISRRFAKNPRSLLYAHLRLGGLARYSDLLAACLRSFLAQATQWHKGVQPIPYVGVPEAARITRACLQLAGQPLDLKSIVALLW